MGKPLMETDVSRYCIRDSGLCEGPTGVAEGPTGVVRDIAESCESCALTSTLYRRLMFESPL